jgi:hypothetical protein
MRKYLILISGLVAVAAAGTIGGVAYAANDDPAPETRYAQVVDGDEAPDTVADREDCPEKRGSSTAPNSEQL